MGPISKFFGRVIENTARPSSAVVRGEGGSQGRSRLRWLCDPGGVI